MTQVIVFPSSLFGEHETGLAFICYMRHGAVWKQGRGRSGNSYAIPCWDGGNEPLPRNARRFHIYNFLAYAAEHPDEQFFVPSDWNVLDVEDFFEHAPDNVKTPPSWKRSPLVTK